MAISNRFFLKTDNTVKIVDLKDEDDALVNGATVLMGLYKAGTSSDRDADEMSPLAGDVALNKTGGDSGIPIADHPVLATDKVRFYGSDNYDGKYAVSDIRETHTIDTIDEAAAPDEFKISGDYAADFPATCTFIVSGSTAAANNGVFTVAAGGASHAAGVTTIPVDEDLVAEASPTGEIKAEVVITKAYAAEVWTGREKLFVAPDPTNGVDITLTEVGATATYKGTLPDTLVDIVERNWYHLFIDITKAAMNLLVKVTWKAVYYPEET